MARLVKGLYGTEFDHKSELFGLLCGQMRSDNRMGRNNGWYNQAGEKLGFGDLSAEDLQRISDELEQDELFVLLGERDSFWGFAMTPGAIGSMSVRSAAESAPGVEYVAEHCTYIIARDVITMVSEYTKGGMREINDLQVKVISRADAKMMLGVATPGA